MRKAATLLIATSLFVGPSAHIFSDGSPIDEEDFQHKTTSNAKTFTGKVSRSKVRLRTQPTLDGTVVKELDRGDMVVVVGEEDGFYSVLPPPNTKAYVYRTFVLDGIIEGNRVNVRLNPNTEAPVIAQMNSGDKIDGTISSDNNKWYEITPPNTTRFYVANEYIDKVGNVQYFKQYQQRLEEVTSLLNATYLLSQQELEKDFADIKPDNVTENYKKIITYYSEFPEQVNQAKTYLTEFEDTYLHKKVAYLESKTQSYSDSWNQKNKKFDQEVEEQKSKLSNLESELKEAQQAQSANRAYQNWIEEKFAAEVNSRMSLWIPVELGLYDKWAKENDGRSIQEFYTVQKGQSVALRGILETYDRPVKNKPGDYVLVNRRNRLPIAYLYSTHVNLNDKLGQEVNVEASLRPNHSYAYPAYFVLGVE